MPQPKYEWISIALSLYAGDQVSEARLDGLLYSSAERLSAINQARQSLYLSVLTESGVEKFVANYPEFVDIRTKTISPAKAPDIKHVFKVYHGGKIHNGIPRLQAMDYKTSGFSKWKTTEDLPKFVEYQDKVEVFGTNSNSANMIYLKQPTDIVPGATDLIEPWIWCEQITRIALTILQGSKGEYPQRPTQDVSTSNYVVMDGEVVTYYGSSGVNTQVLFADSYEATLSIREWLIEQWYDYANIPSLTGGIYFVNVTQLTEEPYTNGANIVCQFGANTLSIPCPDAAIASVEIDYIIFVYRNANIKPEDIKETVSSLADLRDRIANGEEGDIYELSPGQYVVDAPVVMRNEVYAHLPYGAELITEVGYDNHIFSMTDVNGRSSIYGKADIIQKDTGNSVRVLYLPSGTGQILRIGCRTATTNTNFAMFYEHGSKMVVKAQTLYSANRICDNDNLAEGFVLDAMEITAGSELFFPDSTVDMGMYVKNVFLKKTGGFLYAAFTLFGGLSEMYLTTSFCLFQGYAYIFDISFIGAPLTKWYMWSTFLTPTTANFLVDIYDPLIRFYSQCFGTEEILPGYIDGGSIGTYTEDALVLTNLNR